MDVVFSFEKDVEGFLKKISLPLAEKRFLVGLSGGADSVALINVLHSVGERLGFGVEAMHVNHGIRGDEAERDELFCKKLCVDMGVRLQVVRADIPSLAAEKKQSLELCGREFRYGAFAEYAEKNGIDYIATAHNANDNAETVLYNLLRGSGAEGLCGIPVVRGNIVRPILGMSRERIEEYVNALGVGYVTDGTNADTAYTRNYIRNVLLPACKRVNADAVSAINRASAAVEEDCELIENIAEDFYKKEDAVLCDMPRAVRVRAIRMLYSRYSDSVLESVHINAVDKALFAKGQRCVSLPDAVTAVVYGGRLSFEKTEGKERSAEPVGEIPLSTGENAFAGGLVKITVDCHRESADVYFNKNAIKGRLTARRRHSGDKIRVHGMGRSVKKCFIDKKIPPSARQIMPIICDDEGIIYVPYIGVADRVRPSKGDERLGIAVSIHERVGLFRNEEL